MFNNDHNGLDDFSGPFNKASFKELLEALLNDDGLLLHNTQIPQCTWVSPQMIELDDTEKDFVDEVSLQFTLLHREL